MQRPTAKQYFFRELLGSEEQGYHLGRDISVSDALLDQFAARHGESREQILEQLKQHLAVSTTYSNDPAFDGHVRDLRVRNAEWVDPRFIEGLYVAKVRDPVANAVAVHRSDDYEGLLVLVNVGFTLATLFVAECFLHYARNLLEVDIEDERSRKFFDGINEIFHEWRAQGSAISLVTTLPFKTEQGFMPEDLMAADYSILADRFMLAHEIAHHISGDTGHTPVVSSAMHRIRSYALSMPHQKHYPAESVADVLGLQLLIGSPSEKVIESPDFHRLFEALLGSLLACTTIALLSEDPYAASSSHPSANARFDNAMASIASFEVFGVLDNPDSGKIEAIRRSKRVRKDLMEFQDLLNRSRNIKSEKIPNRPRAKE